ncbi:MAG TPA: hypothetical protein VMJ32_01265 [Pirellulales bacterium]|nr:hypothetical protein [Pirellulales bacterium]
MNSHTQTFTPANDRAELVMAQLEDASTRMLAPRQASPPAIVVHQRDPLGRFTPGCPPGPGRPRKLAPRHFVTPLSLYQRVLDMHDSVNTWNNVIQRLGPAAARAFLADLEAEQGPISFRHLVLEAIAAAQRRALAEKKFPPTHCR